MLAQGPCHSAKVRRNICTFNIVFAWVSKPARRMLASDLEAVGRFATAGMPCSLARADASETSSHHACIACPIARTPERQEHSELAEKLRYTVEKDELGDKPSQYHAFRGVGSFESGSSHQV